MENTEKTPSNTGIGPARHPTSGNANKNPCIVPDTRLQYKRAGVLPPLGACFRLSKFHRSVVGWGILHTVRVQL